MDKIDDDPGFCWSCDGSGEGRVDGSLCSRCSGSGTDRAGTKLGDEDGFTSSFDEKAWEDRR